MGEKPISLDVSASNKFCRLLKFDTLMVLKENCKLRMQKRESVKVEITLYKFIKCLNVHTKDARRKFYQ